MKKALLEAIYEYLLVTTPVGLYVLLEAMHRECLAYFFFSPEWSIATIFLAFQGISLYMRGINGLKAKFSPASMGLLALFTVLVIVFSSINAFQSLSHDTGLLMKARVSLFICMSTLFLLLVSGAHFVTERQRRRNGP